MAGIVDLTPNKRAPNIEFIRAEVRKRLTQWRMIKDCIEGEKMVKTRRVLYLPQPNPEDTSKENMDRYNSYLCRAVFYNVTKRTLSGLIGQIFLREPTAEVPEALDSVLEQGGGERLPLVQVARKAAEAVIAYGRAGILADYPKTGGEVTPEDVASGVARASICVYMPWDIINWRTKKIGAKEVLSLVVLRERYPYFDDGFEVRFANQFRVLRLDDAGYSVTVYQKPSPDTNGVYSQIDTEDMINFGLPIGNGSGSVYAISEQAVYPQDSTGQPFKEIPFAFIGSDSNDSTVDDPPLYDLAILNISHYRNSADYEESSFITGQPTPVFTGLTEDWVTKMLKGTVALGARAAVALPINATAALLQASPNSMPHEAMTLKQEQMIAIGAKLVEPKMGQRTATEATMDNVSETSVLGAIANNVSEAFEQGLKWAGQYLGVDPSQVEFELNTDFDIANISPQERTQLIAEWQAGAITFGEMRGNLRQAGVATLDDAEAKAIIDKEQAAEVATIVAKNSAMGLDPSGNVPLTPDPNKTPPKPAPGA